MINLGKSAGKPLADKLGLISVKQLETQNIRFFGEFFTFIITCILRRPFKYGVARCSDKRLNTGMAPTCGWMIKIVKVNNLYLNSLHVSMVNRVSKWNNEISM